jgi:hypothetical protein
MSIDRIPTVYFRPEGTPISALKPGEAVITKREVIGEDIVLHASYIPYKPVDYICVTLEIVNDIGKPKQG